MKQIFLDEETFYFKGRLDNPISNRVFLSKLKTIYYEYPQFIIKKTEQSELNKVKEGETIPFRPHVQLDITAIRLEESLNIQVFVHKKLSEFYNYTKDYIVRSWVLFAGNSDNLNFYHDHPHVNYVPTQWSFCYYVQIPDNLKGDEGKLMFKTKAGIENGFLPEESDLVIFPGDLQHKPVDHLNSSIERVVFCGNFSFLNTNGIKINKSVL